MKILTPGDPRAPSTHSSDVEKVWIRHARAGDQEAFRSIFTLYYGRLCTFAEMLLRSPEAAQDAVQEVFVRVWELRQSCDGCDTLAGYLFTAVRNRALKVLRHRSVVRRTMERLSREARSPAEGVHFPHPAPLATPEEEARASELAAALERILDHLPTRTRQAYLLHRRGGMTYPEIAAAMGISVRTVENHIARALKDLRHGLADWTS